MQSTLVSPFSTPVTFTVPSPTKFLLATVVLGEELKSCLDLVIGSEEMRRNAKKWKDLAREVVTEGGPSDNNLIFGYMNLPSQLFFFGQ
ncbi:hypothetical protein M0R45_020203 [Rubus argutus]|uniref:Uncharacterized protein n=1 Tax=Rubus argutus TaxID=59490 RepID=A0AAW1XAZ2_RUBAR